MIGSLEMRPQSVHSMDYPVRAVILLKKSLLVIILIESVNQFKFNLTMRKVLPALVFGLDVSS